MMIPTGNFTPSHIVSQNARLIAFSASLKSCLISCSVFCSIFLCFKINTHSLSIYKAIIYFKDGKKKKAPTKCQCFSCELDGRSLVLLAVLEPGHKDGSPCTDAGPEEALAPVLGDVLKALFVFDHGLLALAVLAIVVFLCHFCKF